MREVLTNKTAIGLAALLGAAEPACAQLDLRDLSVSEAGKIVRAELAKTPPRPDLIVLGKNADLSALVKSDPLVVVLGLPQHGQTNLASEAAFEYALAKITPADKTGSRSNLFERTSAFLVPLHKSAIASGVKKADEHLRLIDSLKGLDGDQTNRVALYADESLRHLVEVYETLPQVGAPAEHQDRLRDSIHIARNLYFAGLSADENTISRARLELAVFRDRFYAGKPFEGKSVVFMAHSERMTDFSTQLGRTVWSKEDAGRFIKSTGDEHRFGKAETQQRIKMEAVTRGGSFTFLRAEQLSQLHEIKIRTLQAIEQTPPGPKGFTFVFDGHGAPDAIFLSSGEVPVSQAAATNAGRTVSITTAELAQAFRKRAVNFPQRGAVSDDRRDVVMIIGCFSQNLIRDLGSKLGGMDAAPFMISASEFGQFGYSAPGSPYGSKAFHPAFSKAVDKPGSRQLKPATTFGDIINLGVLPDVRPTFFIPERVLGVSEEPITEKVPKAKLPYRQIGALPRADKTG